MASWALRAGNAGAGALASDADRYLWSPVYRTTTRDFSGQNLARPAVSIQQASSETTRTLIDPQSVVFWLSPGSTWHFEEIAPALRYWLTVEFAGC